MKCLVALKEGVSSLKNNLNILHMSTKKLLALANFTFYLKFIKGFLMYQVDQLSLIVAPRQENVQSF